MVLKAIQEDLRAVFDRDPAATSWLEVVLTYAGFKLTHVINITDVGHLTDDADAGEDKMEKMAAEKAQSIWDIAKHYTEAYWADIKALNIRQPAHWSIATAFRSWGCQ